MGNDTSSYSTCELGPYYETATSAPWTLHNGKCADGTRVSVYLYEIEEISRDAVTNSIKNLKTLKHPNIVKFLGLKESRNEIWIITESVRPLEAVIDTMTAEEICAGIHSLLHVLSFLHQVGLCHNNICMSSVFVGLDGSWKLCGLEWICKFSDATSSHLAAATKWRSTQAIAPEEKDKNFAPSERNGHARDVYAFGHLAEQLLEYLTSLGDLTKTFELRVSDECLNADPEQRLQLSSLLDDRLFKCDYVDILQFLKTLTVQNEDDKQKFFSSLVKRLYGLPVALVASRLSRPLLARFVLLEKSASQNLLPHLLTPAKGEDRTRGYVEGEVNPVLPEPVFQKYLIPELFKIFHVRDAHVRITLLKHFNVYVNQFDKNLLRSTILPQILLGVRDTNDELVALSLHALAKLVHVLGGDVVIGAHRARVFSQGTPKTRSALTENGVLLNGPSENRSTKLSMKSENMNEEREKKRQEARKRMEERRRKREEHKQKQTQKVKNIPTNLESDDGGPADLNKDRSETNSVHDTQDLNTNKDPELPISEEKGSEEDITDEEYTPLDITESDIDQEIEAEINAMESTLPPEKITKMHSDVKVDWSDISPKSLPIGKGSPSSGGRNVHKGSLKLSKKTRTSPPPKSQFGEGDKSYSRSSSQEMFESNRKQTTRNRESGESGEDWGTGWDDSKAGDNEWADEWQDYSHDDNASSNHPKPASPKHVQKHATTKTNKSQNNSKQLGAEFDIMALDIKSLSLGSSEVDYFADMIPEIKPKADTLMRALSMSDPSGEGKGDKKNKNIAVSFAANETAETGEDGWDVAWEET